MSLVEKRQEMVFKWLMCLGFLLGKLVRKTVDGQTHWRYNAPNHRLNQNSQPFIVSKSLGQHLNPQPPAPWIAVLHQKWTPRRLRESMSMATPTTISFGREEMTVARKKKICNRLTSGPTNILGMSCWYSVNGWDPLYRKVGCKSSK